MIAIIDYGMGNLRSVQKAFELIGYEAKITNKLQDISDASHIVLPGVGAIKDAMQSLRKVEIIDKLFSEIKNGKPFLGICLGMQMLFDYSTEGGRYDCLKLIDGHVDRFKNEGLKVPHVGWNKIEVQKETPLLKGIEDPYFYFVHSFHATSVKKEDVLTTTNYMYDFVSSVSKDNIYGVQFHPEKSGDTGLKLLKNFGGIK